MNIEEEGKEEPGEWSRRVLLLELRRILKPI